MAFHALASLLYSMMVGRVGRTRVLCWSLWRVLLPDDLVIHQTRLPPLQTFSHLQTPPPHQCSSARPFRAGISTLISHLWLCNELRLLIHL